MRHKEFLPGLAALALTVGMSQVASGQLASRPAEEWAKTLEASTRLTALKIDEIVPKLGLKPGNIVADIGAGTGVFEVPLAKAVSPGGKVYAVDIDQGFFSLINHKAEDQHVTNVQTVLGKFTDPNLPTKDVDLALLHDVLHHVQDRAGYLKALTRYLKRSARIAIVDYKGAQGPHQDQPELQVTEKQVDGWLAEAGFKPSPDMNLFPDKFFVIYSR